MRREAGAIGAEGGMWQTAGGQAWIGKNIGMPLAMATMNGGAAFSSGGTPADVAKAAFEGSILGKLAPATQEGIARFMMSRMNPKLRGSFAHVLQARVVEALGEAGMEAAFTAAIQDNLDEIDVNELIAAAVVGAAMGAFTGEQVQQAKQARATRERNLDLLDLTARMQERAAENDAAREEVRKLNEQARRDNIVEEEGAYEPAPVEVGPEAGADEPAPPRITEEPGAYEPAPGDVILKGDPKFERGAEVDGEESTVYVNDAGDELVNDYIYTDDAGVDWLPSVEMGADREWVRLSMSERGIEIAAEDGLGDRIEQRELHIGSDDANPIPYGEIIHDAATDRLIVAVSGHPDVAILTGESGSDVPVYITADSLAEAVAEYGYDRVSRDVLSRVRLCDPASHQRRPDSPDRPGDRAGHTS